MNVVEMLATNDLHSRHMIALLIATGPKDKLLFLDPALLEDVFDSLGDEVFSTIDALDLPTETRNLLRRSIARESTKFPYPRDVLPS